MNKKYEFSLNLKLKDLTFKHNLTKFFPTGEELIFKSLELTDLDTALDAVQGFTDDVRLHLSSESGLDLVTQAESPPVDIQSTSEITWQKNELLKVWILNTSTNQPYALAQLMEIQ